MPGGLSRPGLAIKLLANKNCILWVLLPFLSFSSRTYSFPSGSSGFDMVLILILTIGREGSSIDRHCCTSRFQSRRDRGCLVTQKGASWRLLVALIRSAPTNLNRSLVDDVLRSKEATEMLASGVAYGALVFCPRQ